MNLRRDIAIAMMHFPGSRAQEYVRGRRIRDDVAKRFGLGDCPSGSSLFDSDYRMQEKVVIPIVSASNEILSYSGRDYAGKDKSFKCQKQKGFPKNTVLYGLNCAWKSIVEQDFAIIVEGEFDCMKMHSVGINNTISIMGSAFSMQQCAILKMYTSNVYFFTDNDGAGAECINKAKTICDFFAMSQYDLRSVVYPTAWTASDPDELVDALVDYGVNPKDYINERRAIAAKVCN